MVTQWNGVLCNQSTRIVSEGGPIDYFTAVLSFRTALLLFRYRTVGSLTLTEIASISEIGLVDKSSDAPRSTQ